MEETAVRRGFFHEDDNSGGTSWRKKEVKARRKIEQKIDARSNSLDSIL